MKKGYIKEGVAEAGRPRASVNRHGLLSDGFGKDLGQERGAPGGEGSQARAECEGWAGVLSPDVEQGLWRAIKEREGAGEMGWLL